EGLRDESMPEDTRVLFLGIRGAVQLASGDLDGAAHSMQELRPFAESYPDSAVAAMVGWSDGLADWMHDAFAHAVRKFERSLPGTALFSGGEEQGLLLVAMALCLADRVDAAYAALETARIGLERRGMLTYLAEHHWFLGNTHFIAGSWDDALAEIDASHEVTARTGAPGLA